jgi:hypothetical protein
VLKFRWLTPLLLLAPLACEDPEETDGGTPDSGVVVVDSGAPDRGFTDTGVDTGVTGDAGFDPDAAVDPDSGPDPDGGLPEDGGPPADSGADSGVGPTDTGPTPDSGPITGPVTVRFEVNGQPYPGTAVFHDPSGAVTAVLSSTTGSVQSVVVAGSMVTVPAFTFTGKGPSLQELRTVVGVVPGEEYLVTPFFSEGGPANQLGDLEVSLPGLYAGADSYSYEYGCGVSFFFDPLTPELVPLDDFCTGSSTTTVGVLAVARDAAASPIAYTFLENVPVVAGGVTQVNLPAWQTAFVDLGVTFTNPPPSSGEVTFQRELSYQGRRFGGVFTQVDLSVAPPWASAWNVAPFGQGTVTGILFPRNDVPGESYQFSHEAGLAPLNVDLGTLLLPAETSSVTPDPLVPERPTFGWIMSTPVDAHILHLSYESPGASWSFLVPAGQTSFRAPELPVELESLAPEPGTNFYSGVISIDVVGLQSYDLVRTAFRSAFFSEFNGLNTLTAPAPGQQNRISFQGFIPFGG